MNFIVFYFEALFYHHLKPFKDFIKFKDFYFLSNGIETFVIQLEYYLSNKLKVITLSFRKSSFNL